MTPPDNRHDAFRGYEIDSELVAREILAKLRIIRRVRRQIEDEDGGSRPGSRARPRRKGRFTRKPEQTRSAPSGHEAQPAL